MAIALLQVFTIGFSLGFTGPCLFYCLPIILTFTSGVEQDHRKSLGDILVFFFGRLSAYILLGCLAGMSGMILRRFINSNLAVYLNPLAGLISIGLGALVAFNKKTAEGRCVRDSSQAGVFGGLFLFGFIIGISPCAPLLVLLFEIVLISKNAFQGALYGLSFGLGTFISGAIIAVGFSGLLTRLPEKFLKSEKVRFTLRIVCALVLILFGLWFILGQKR
jgi:sulfite exporter TauE/SafE